jgi:single-stranded DNA-binding protein
VENANAMTGAGQQHSQNFLHSLPMPRFFHIQCNRWEKRGSWKDGVFLFCDFWTFGLLNKFIQNYMREFQKICSESNLIHQHWEESEQIFLAL